MAPIEASVNIPAEAQMSAQRMSRRELTKAGSMMGADSVRFIDDTLPEGATKAFAEKAVDLFLTAMEQQAAIYLEDGVPPKWVREFKSAFLRTMRAEFLALQRAAAQRN
ncbi:hypothetical protein [Methylobacterium iners]|uniref:Phasin domain-containing protein n=1 Tax=Methylobacterium iners TaxID=418707 RepID=A0ABQ4S1B7_9HYPH|nr:hypothetical protein [Methylobacterium iners]GJD96905.1 hypothetical protein OCOJLMKI_4132 [Methylobacterium iners]